MRFQKYILDGLDEKLVRKDQYQILCHMEYVRGPAEKHPSPSDAKSLSKL